MLAPDLISVDALLFLGRIYDWIVRRKLPISLFALVAILFVSANVGYVALKCGKKDCPIGDCITYQCNASSTSSPSPQSSVSSFSSRSHGGDSRLCFSFSSRNVARLCSKFDPPALFARGFIYNVDGILSYKNGSLRLIPVILYPTDIPYPMPRDCLNQCITQSKAIMSHLAHVRAKYIADIAD